MLKGAMMSSVHRTFRIMAAPLSALVLALICCVPAAFAQTCPISTGTAATLGAPSSIAFNGLALVQDRMHRVATHAIDATRIPLADATPYIPNVKLLGRRDSLIVYVPNVAGAADYRAYVLPAGASQPKVMACAGYRQRAWAALENPPYDFQSPPATLPPVVRELIQAIEIPGLNASGDYTIVVEALARPCPFTGLPGHTNALIPNVNNRLATLTGGSVPIVNAAEATRVYGAEILNGQGASSDWFLQAGQQRGQPASAENIAVIARSKISVTIPFADEAVNAPIIDVGSNAVFDDFRTDAIASEFTAINARSFGSTSTASKAFEGAFGNWYFWGNSTQAAIGENAGGGSLGGQVWTRHGRLNITLADWAQDVFGAIHFSSRTTKPLALDNALYAHSFFRVDSGATGRRYWHWMMCGANDITTLVDPATNIARIRHLLRPGFYDAGGVNPTAPTSSEATTPSHNRECLNLLQLPAANPDAPKLADGSNGPLPTQTLVTAINPANTASGTINLAPAVFNRGFGAPAWPWRLDENNNYAGPLIEPFDQQAPLAHYDIFVRPDRLIVFVNGRQGLCVNMSARPLAMNFGHIVYGQVLYHSDAEVDEYYVPQRTNANIYQPPFGLFHYTVNTPAADHRAWDAVGHTEKIAIPALFNFNANLCKTPETFAVK
jgi:hypothetical protein